ncbi:histidine--tRNA ligase [Nonomuraea turcica]|uniref:histidine--tRNA ligase n=1 Tax=Nonomuraea sp. G32 TaxID=3067274 RepID=UPI00273B3383|nr:histidine--tRNA ligase [Nonomuraea sp. G32]MDP4500516.1 histidine--tRNA ligase [Nonomuraea sp. G32]
MSRFLPTAPYRGTRDFLPDEMSVRQQVFSRLYEAVERYGYVRYDGPILESADIYEAKSGREIADQQLYSLTDRAGRRLALRPEMTPSVARMIAGHAGELQFPVRWYSHVNCHRYERPQRGRVREHWQINVDVFGSDSPNCEIEIFQVIHDMMASLGATRDMYVLRANDRILLESLLVDVIGIPHEKVRDVSSILDRWAKYPREQLLDSALQLEISEQQFERIEVALKSDESLLPEMPAETLERSPLARILAGPGRDLVVFDPSIVRAFEYYTATVFEVFDTNPANSRSLFGGGRYSDLVGLFSDQRIPGIGFGMGDVTLMDFLDTHGLLPTPKPECDVAVMPVEEELLPVVRDIAGELRAAGYRTVVPLESRKLGKELKRADRSGARAGVIVGPDDWQRGMVGVRDLAGREQQTVPREEVVAAVAQILSSPRPDRTTI